MLLSEFLDFPDLALLNSVTGVIISGNPFTLEWSIGDSQSTGGLLGPISDLICGLPLDLSNPPKSMR